MIIKIRTIVLFLSIFQSFQVTQAKRKKAIIVGAGLSGLTTALELSKQGYTIQILEARNRIGGRVKTIHMGNQTGEAGGEFIDHPKVHTLMHKYAKKLGVEVGWVQDHGWDQRIEDFDWGAYYYEGNLIPEGKFKKFFGKKINKWRSI